MPQEGQLFRGVVLLRGAKNAPAIASRVRLGAGGTGLFDRTITAWLLQLATSSALAVHVIKGVS